MKKIDLLRHYGLFDAKVPRYTSYPPANHFLNGIGQRRQAEWLRAVPDSSDVSVYIHIPFCKRLCWFCACRTQGTKTMRPVDAYATVLRREIDAVRSALPDGIRMARLHLGGGTPTILSKATMTDLLQTVFAAFDKSENFEFSAEIDPTDATEDILQTLIDFGINRASIGVQDFSPIVQNAIGRPQSLAQTKAVVGFLRKAGIGGLNLDLLYGLPHQTQQSFQETLGHVCDMRPDRLAIYGYAHVPWMSKRQVMIHTKDLPDGEERFELAETAERILTADGYHAIGIDHFSLPTDPLFLASDQGHLHRNFQGYTDDQSPTLIGFGASAISRFDQGYVQNTTATSAYQDRVSNGGFAGHKGYQMTEQDHLIASMIEDLMCRFSIREQILRKKFPDQTALVRKTIVSLMIHFPDTFFISEGGLKLNQQAHALVRVIASYVDRFASTSEAHSAAI